MTLAEILTNMPEYGWISGLALRARINRRRPWWWRCSRVWFYRCISKLIDNGAIECKFEPSLEYGWPVQVPYYKVKT